MRVRLKSPFVVYLTARTNFSMHIIPCFSESENEKGAIQYYSQYLLYRP
jgi:hypothetical protein